MLKRYIFSVSVAALLFPLCGSAEVKPYLLTPKTTYDSQPTLTTDSKGTLWAGWVAYAHPGGDTLMVASLQDGQWSAPEPVNSTRLQMIRPTLAQAGGSLCAFWTETGEKHLARIMFSRRADGKWSEPTPISSEQFASQNQEPALDQQGRLHVVWQQYREGQFDLVMKTFADGKWSEPVAVTDGKYDDWDPAIVCDSNGAIWVAWSSFRGGDYDVYIKRVDQPGKEMRLGTRGSYDLHPSLAADHEGRVWAAWDNVIVPRHGSSGRTTITGANLAANPREKSNDPEADKPLVAHIRLACLQDGKLLQIPNASKALVPPPNYWLAHTALPKISVDDSGTVWIAYRGLSALFTKEGADKVREPGQPVGKAQLHNKGPYWWEVFVQSFRDGQWVPAEKMPLSDGTLEEVATLCTKDGLQIAYEMEHRRRLSSGLLPKDYSESDDHHGDYGAILGFNGDVYYAHLDARTNGAAAAQSLVARKALADKPVRPRVARDLAHYQTEVGGKKYMLLWGNLHKHSNISRCSIGSEPSPDDHYKYARDICQYDFLAMSDHSEHTSDFNWWRIQKLADLYNVPGSFSVLYGYEWSAHFPWGHHNVIFYERPTQILRSSLAATKTTDGLWAALSKFGQPALTVPHTLSDPGMGTRWDTHDDRYERIAEIFQACRGSYEYDGCPRQHENATVKGSFFQDALAKDYRLGTICSSDHGWGTAYAVAYATENSRKAAFQALYDRRCYGSTTYGLVVDFHMADHTMGEEFSLSQSEPIKVFTRGAVPIRSVEILSEGKIVFAKGSVKEPINTIEASIEWKPELPASGKTNYYYARIIQTDDEMAWTSPVWVTAK